MCRADKIIVVRLSQFSKYRFRPSISFPFYHLSRRCLRKMRVIKFANVVEAKVTRINLVVKNEIAHFILFFLLHTCRARTCLRRNVGQTNRRAAMHLMPFAGREESTVSELWAALSRRSSSLIPPTLTLLRSSSPALRCLFFALRTRGEDVGAGSPQSERRYLKHMQRVQLSSRRQPPRQGERGKKSRTMAACVRLPGIRLTTIYATSATTTVLLLVLPLFLFLLSSHSHPSLSFCPLRSPPFSPCLPPDRHSKERERERERERKRERSVHSFDKNAGAPKSTKYSIRDCPRRDHLQTHRVIHPNYLRFGLSTAKTVNDLLLDVWRIFFLLSVK